MEANRVTARVLTPSRTTTARTQWSILDPARNESRCDRSSRSPERATVACGVATRPAAAPPSLRATWLTTSETRGNSNRRRTARVREQTTKGQDDATHSRHSPNLRRRLRAVGPHSAARYSKHISDQPRNGRSAPDTQERNSDSLNRPRAWLDRDSRRSGNGQRIAARWYVAVRQYREPVSADLHRMPACICEARTWGHEPQRVAIHQLVLRARCRRTNDKLRELVCTAGARRAENEQVEGGSGVPRLWCRS